MGGRADVSDFARELACFVSPLGSGFAVSVCLFRTSAMVVDVCVCVLWMCETDFICILGLLGAPCPLLRLGVVFQPLFLSYIHSVCSRKTRLGAVNELRRSTRQCIS